MPLMSNGKTSRELQMSVILWLSYHFHRYYDLGFSICHDLLIIVKKTSMTNSLQLVSLLVVIDFKWMAVQLLLACWVTLQSILVKLQRSKVQAPRMSKKLMSTLASQGVHCAQGTTIWIWFVICTGLCVCLCNCFFVGHFCAVPLTFWSNIGLGNKSLWSLFSALKALIIGGVR